MESQLLLSGLLYAVADDIMSVPFRKERKNSEALMMQKTFTLERPVREAAFTVREDHTLAVKLQLGCGSRTVVPVAARM